MSAPATRPSLLLRLRDADDAAAWAQFVDIYTPLIFGYCRSRGLQEADAADVAQESMRAVARAMSRFEYNPQQGRFRNWLLTVVQSKLNNFRAQQLRQPTPASATSLQLKIDREPASAENPTWEADYYRALFNWAAKRIRHEFQESTWKAFWMTAVEERDGKEVADGLGMSVGGVYVAKSRVLARLKQEILAIDSEEGPHRFLL